MENIILPLTFYITLAFCIRIFFKRFGFKKIINVETILRHKVIIAGIFYYYFNINIWFYCSYCKVCSSLHLPILAMAVFMGVVLYSMYLIVSLADAVTVLSQTDKAIKWMKVLGVFFLLQYLPLVKGLSIAIITADFSRMSQLQDKMIIPLLFCFFGLIMELYKLMIEKEEEKRLYK
jgi:hypothetical protein